jgi:hypothetical protein
MPEKPKPKGEAEEKELAEADKSSWSEDQKMREYYYDDAHGYEAYDPAEDDETEISDEPAKSGSVAQ